MANVSPTLNVMIAAARKAGRSARPRFRRGRAAAGLRQGPGQLRLGRRPQGRGHHLQGAGQGAARLRLPDGGARRGRRRRQDHRWIVDPLDGTTNFLHGIPLFAISIGLEREGQLVAGVIYNPASDELFTAEKGKGAFLNDRRLRVAARKTLGRRASSRPAFPIAAAPGHPGFLSEMADRHARGGGPPPHRLGRPRSRLDRGWPLRRLLGAQHQALGSWRPASSSCGRPAASSRDLDGGDEMLEYGRRRRRQRHDSSKLLLPPRQTRQ